MKGPTIVPPLVDENHKLAPDQYFDEVIPKDLIVLHHTVSGNWPGTVKFWGSDTARVGTAYGVDKDGRVYRAFPDDRWAIHLFRQRKGLSTESAGNFTNKDALGMEKRSIGIEIVSWGVLANRNGILYNAFGTGLGGAENLLAHGKVIKLDKAWRTFTAFDNKVEPSLWFDAYTEDQIIGTLKLVNYLCLTKNIPTEVPLSIGRADDAPRSYIDFRGVVSHAMLRPDKTDTHPGFPYARLAYSLGSPGWK